MSRQCHFSSGFRKQDEYGRGLREASIARVVIELRTAAKAKSAAGDVLAKTKQKYSDRKFKGGEACNPPRPIFENYYRALPQ